ncbi:MAG TPA: N-acetyl-gamma-glutamyl-phosphate reductase [Gammaproteobacteria bacterium]|nr:N-acetyl-gamma-glutamyl-phosphate reductase [Gammaproteobacteria bacterium]
MIRVGVLGATGYMGGEVLRVLLDHPEVEIAWATARRGGNIEDYHPNLFGSGITLTPPDETDTPDVVYTALPTAVSIKWTRRFLDAGSRVIDLGAAFRLTDRAQWEATYAQSHSDWPLAEEAVYGISELHREAITATRLVANPGCFASAAIFALAPLLAEGIVEPGQLVVTGLSGSAGMGAGLSRAAHHAEIGNNLVPYNVVDHRHSYEMEQELRALVPAAVAETLQVHFTPVYAPITRGILNICHAFADPLPDRPALLELFRTFYAMHPFVRIYDVEGDSGEAWHYRPWPWVSAVSGSNYCYLGLEVDEKRGRIVVFSVLDSLGKGGAQAGIENMNLMMGLPRTMGLRARACHPA